jgi:hypothetical protein
MNAGGMVGYFFAPFWGNPDSILAQTFFPFGHLVKFC